MTIPLYLPTPNEISKAYKQQRFVFLPQIIKPTYVSRCLEDIADIEVRRVICGIPNVEWGEQQIPESSRVGQLFLSREWLNLIEYLAEQQYDESASIRCWTSIYRLNEYINPHRDRAGTIQALLCLKNSGGGGRLVLNLEEEEVTYNLHPGDAIIFEATRVTHYTTPILSTDHERTPERIVAVARYYL